MSGVATVLPTRWDRRCRHRLEGRIQNYVSERLEHSNFVWNRPGVAKSERHQFGQQTNFGGQCFRTAIGGSGSSSHSKRSRLVRPTRVEIAPSKFKFPPRWSSLSDVERYKSSGMEPDNALAAISRPTIEGGPLLLLLPSAKLIQVTPSHSP